MNKHIPNIIITVILTLSLFIFGLYILTRRGDAEQQYLTEELLPARINSLVLSIQTRLYPVFIAGETVSRSIEIHEARLTETSIVDILKTTASHPGLAKADGYDCFSSETSSLYSYNGGAISTVPIHNGDRWIAEVLKDPKSSKMDLLFTSDTEKIYVYLRYPLYTEEGRYAGFLGLRFEYDRISEFILEEAKEEQSILWVNQNGQILFETDSDGIIFSNDGQTAFLSQRNPRQYLGILNRHLGIEDESLLRIDETEASYLRYNGLMNMYLIVEDRYAPAPHSEKLRTTLPLIAIGIFLLLVNVYTIFSYQRLILEKNKKLAELLREKEMFLSVMSHNVNNTIAVLSNDLHSALTKKEHLSFQRKMILLSWMDTTKRLITNIIFYLSHIEKGGTVAKNEKIDFVELIQTLLIRNRERGELKEQNIVFESELREFPILTNKNLLMEALDNVVDNAIKYSPAHSTVYLKLGRNETGEAVVNVSDEGPGFSEEDRKNLFEPFIKGSAKPTGGEKSTGLGLYVVRSIVERLGGTIELLRKKEKGASFVLTFPPK